MNGRQTKINECINIHMLNNITLNMDLEPQKTAHSFYMYFFSQLAYKTIDSIYIDMELT